MKKNIIISAFLIVLAWESHGQKNDCPCQYMDSINIHYRATEWDDLADVTLKLDRNTLSVYEVVNKPLYALETKQIYRTHNTDTIDYLFGCIKFVINNPPIYDSDYVVIDCCDEMSISIFGNDNVCEFSYVHYRDAYFPFAYAELYCVIRQFLAKYRRMD